MIFWPFTSYLHDFSGSKCEAHPWQEFRTASGLWFCWIYKPCSCRASSSDIQWTDDAKCWVDISARPVLVKSVMILLTILFSLGIWLQMLQITCYKRHSGFIIPRWRVQKLWLINWQCAQRDMGLWNLVILQSKLVQWLKWMECLVLPGLCVLVLQQVGKIQEVLFKREVSMASLMSLWFLLASTCLLIDAIEDTFNLLCSY